MNETSAPEIKSVLEEAIECTSGDRRRDYDHAKPNHERIAKLWNAYLPIRKDPKAFLTGSDVAVMMILLKLARHAHAPKRDNYTDIAGYAKCLSQIEGFEP
jgi:hypothetical protein